MDVHLKMLLIYAWSYVGSLFIRH